MASCLWGCSESETENLQPTDSIELSKDLIALGFEGGTDEIVVTSTGDWRLAGSSTWVHPSVTEGRSGDAILFTVDPNVTDRNLQSEFKIFTGSAVARLTVTCGEGYVLSLDSDEAVAMSRDGGEFAVRLNTNIPADELTCHFTDEGGDWISSGESMDVFGDLVMQFTMAENAGYSDRSSRLTISGHDLSIEVAVSQAALDYLNVKCEKIYEFEDMSAASFTVEVEHNIDYTVSVPDWITYEKIETRALTTDVLQFNVAEGTSTRLADVVIADAEKQYEFKFSVRQFAPGAQIISIPDAGFRKKLSENGWIAMLDENSPEVILYDYETIKKNDWYPDILRVNGAGIKSLEGIEHFTWVTQCNLNGNSELEKVDISALTKVATIDVSGDAMLSEIICGENACKINWGERIGVSDVTITGGVTSINLTAYYISGDQLKTMDVSGCPNLSLINARGRDQLTTIYITAEQEGMIALTGTATAGFVIKQ